MSCMAKTIKSIKAVKQMSLIEKIKELSRQRRVWSALLSGVAVFGIIAGFAFLVPIASGIAGVLGLDSYLRPSEIEAIKKRKKRKSTKK